MEEANKPIFQSLSCTNCGSNLTYKPGTETITCAHCQTANVIPQAQMPIEEKDFETYLAKELQNEPCLKIQIVTCNGCGAETTLDPKIKSHTCAYCASPLVINDLHEEAVLVPKAILPFKITDKEAKNILTNWLKKLWFAPNALKAGYQNLERLKGIYVPYFTFDSNTISHYVGQRGDYYYVDVPYQVIENGKNITKIKKEQRIRWRNVAGNVNHFFDDVLIIASKNLPKKYADELEPWDLDKLQPFNYQYVSGFVTERYQQNLKTSFEIAKVKMNAQIEQKTKRAIGGDEQRIIQLKTAYNDVTFKHILLPVYISSLHFDNKTYQLLINARTGEVQGERPYSIIKIVLTILAVLLGLAIIFLVMQ